MKYTVFLLIALIGAAFTGTVLVPSIAVFCPMGMPMAAMAMHQDPPDSPRGEPSEDETQEAPPDDPDAPVGNPGHIQPTEACTPHNRPDGKMPCTCLKQHPEGCSKGIRETEHRSCNSWCWRQMCKCCST